MEDRNDLIRELGIESFNSNPSYEHLKDLPLPKCFIFLFNIFMELHNMSNEVITWTDIASYCYVRNVKLKQTEIDYILRMNSWANESISELKKQEE